MDNRLLHYVRTPVIWPRLFVWCTASAEFVWSMIVESRVLGQPRASPRPLTAKPWFPAPVHISKDHSEPVEGDQRMSYMRCACLACRCSLPPHPPLFGTCQLFFLFESQAPGLLSRRQWRRPSLRPQGLFLGVSRPSCLRAFSQTTQDTAIER